jgi:peptidoglycan/LPS O-acetylase OafA/YrhL
VASSVRLAASQVDFLNLVRAAAAQVVLIGHATHYYLSGRFNEYGRLETFGVLVFFLLSGFLICSSVVQKWDRPDYRFEHYLIDRFCRIFVAYGPALVFVAAADAAMRGHPAFPYGADDSLGTWLGNLAMLQDYPLFQVLRRLGVSEQSWFIRPFGSVRPFWTVAIEWWIYLSFGCLAFFALRSRRINLRALAALAVVGIVPAYNAMGGVGDCLTFVWILGAAFAVLQDRLVRRASTRRPDFPAICMLGIAVSACLLAGRIVVTGLRVYDLQFAIFVSGILFGLFFLAGSVSATLPGPVRRAIDFLANYSYSLYLIHFTVLMVFAVYLPSPTQNDPLKFMAVVAVANLGSMIFWFAFERHYRAIARAAKLALDRRLRSAVMQPIFVEPVATNLTSTAPQNVVDTAREGG